MAEDPRIFLQFKTLAKFKEKLADGTINSNRHLVFIKDEKMIWARGTYYSDNVKSDDISSIYNEWEISQSSGDTITITLKGQLWNDSTRAWETVSKSLFINKATQTVAGLMSATDKTKLDKITGTNYSLSNSSTTATARKIKLSGINPNTGSAVSSEVELPAASTSSAGLMSAVDNKAVGNLRTLAKVSHINDDTTFTADSSSVKLNYDCKGLDENPETTVTSHSVDIGAATAEKAGIMTAASYTQLYTTLPNNITTETNRAVAQENKIEAGIGLNADGTHATTTGNYTAKATTVVGEISALDTQVKKNADAISVLNDSSNTNSVANKIKTAINALDVSDTAVSGQYVSKVSETDGKISVVRTDISSSPLNNYAKGTSSAAITKTDTINTAISKLENQVDAANTAQATAIADAKAAGTTAQSSISTHAANTSNPHSVTKAQVGLGNVTNESKATMFTSAALTGTPTAPTATVGTNSTQIATTAFVNSAVNNSFAANDAMLFKGTIGTSGTVTSLPATHNVGWTYKVITAGTYAGITCEVGDMLICITDGTSANNAHWTVVQTNIDGAVIGPSSATDAAVAIFNGTTGKVIKNSGFTIGKSVPSSAVFTDTHYTTHLYAGSGSAANAATTNGNTKLSIVDNTTVRNSVTIKGSGATSVTSDASGNITITSDLSSYLTTATAASTYLPKSTYTASDIMTKLQTVDGSDSGLDADLLDGYHASGFMFNRDGGYNVSLNDITTSGVWRFGSGITDAPCSMAWSNMLVLRGDDQDSISQLCFPYNNNSHVFIRSGTTASFTGVAWREFAFTDSNVASASQLQTTRSLWGQSFNGTQNVSGDLSGVGSIAASGTVTGASFVKSGGTSTQFLKADGSVDSNTYLTSSSLSGYATQSWVTDQSYLTNSELAITLDEMLSMSETEVKRYLLNKAPCRKVVKSGSRNVGVLDMICDSMGHILTQVFTTNMTLSDGTFNGTHEDGALYVYYRTYGIDSPYLSTGWGEWQQFSPTKEQIESVLTGNITSHSHDAYLTSHQSLAAYLTTSTAASTYLPLSGGTLTGNLNIKENNSIILRPNNPSYTAGISHDTQGNECIALWAKNTVTRLRWYAGKDMSSMSSGLMMGITPDFEISKASGTAYGYIGGDTIATQTWVESKGYLTSHQSLANYVTLSGAQTISGAKTFSADITANGTVTANSVDTRGGMSYFSQIYLGTSLTGGVLLYTGGYGMSQALLTATSDKTLQFHFPLVDENGDEYISSAEYETDINLLWDEFDGYATQSWVTGKGYLTSHQSVVNKAATLAWATTSTIATIGGTSITVKMPSNPNTDTKNTAGSTDSTAKLYLIGATSQASSSVTFSHDTAYVGTDGCLYSGGAKVLTSHQSLSGYATQTWVESKGYLTSHQSLANYVTLSGAQTISGAKTFSADITANGTVTCKSSITATSFYKSSDKRLKSNITELNHTLDQICNIPTSRFILNDKEQIGTIAQDLEKIEPTLIGENKISASEVPNKEEFETFVENDEEYVKVKTVEYQTLSVLAIEGIKLLKQEIDELKKQLYGK